MCGTASECGAVFSSRSSLSQEGNLGRKAFFEECRKKV